MYHLISEKPAESVLPTRSIKRWVIATFCLIVISLIEGCIIVKLATKDSSRGFETGFTTEFPDSKDAITIEKVRFTSPLKVDENGTLHQVNNSNERRYMGDSLEVDQAWEDLIYGRYIRLREPEVDWLDSDKGNENLKEIPAHDPVIAKSGMFGGVDMLYSLHCLNMLRKSLHGKHMKMEVFSEEENNIYPDHCIDQLRQSVMCFADLTPVTLRPVWIENPHRSILLGETERMHTCRNFQAIRDWVTERGLKEGRIEV